MKVKPYLFSIANNLDSLLAAFIGFFLIQIFAKHSGIGVTPDSVTYISACRHMLEGNGFKSFDFLPVVDFPFAYPFFLTVISFVSRLDPLQFGAIVNGLLFGLLLYISGGIMNGFNASNRWYKRILLTCILFSPALQEVYSMIWSETIFLLLILIYILSISTYLRRMDMRWLLISSLLCALVCLTRYAGVFLVITGIFLIFFNEAAAFKKRITHCFIYGTISVFLLAINILRNFMLTGLTTGLREKSDTGIIKIMEYFGGVICDWLLIERKPLLGVFLTALILLVFISTIIYTRRRKNSTYAFEYVMAVTGLVYCLFMISSSVFTRYEQFTNRLLAPVFIPLLWSLSYRIPGILSTRNNLLKLTFGIPVLLAAAWFVNVQLAADWEYYDGVKDAGIPGYREEPFVQSDIVKYLEKNTTIFKPSFPIYSNAAEAVYFISGIPALQLPYAGFTNRVQQYYGLKNSYLIWFSDLDNPEMPALDSILTHKELVLLKKLPDGAVYVTQ